VIGIHVSLKYPHHYLNEYEKRLKYCYDYHEHSTFELSNNPNTDSNNLNEDSKDRYLRSTRDDNDIICIIKDGKFRYVHSFSDASFNTFIKILRNV
jgi:hypothetical protein